MGYKLNSKNLSVNNKPFLNEKENIYGYNGMALKVYPKGRLPEGALSERVAKHLTTIATNRIILPRSILYFNDKYAGFCFNIPSRNSLSGRIITSDSKDLINNIVVLERDLEALTAKRVLLSNLDPEQTLYNGEIYLLDPCGYRIFEEDYFSLETTNRQQLHLLLTEVIVNELKRDQFSKAIVADVLSSFREKDDEMPSSLFFKEKLGENSIKKYIKKYWE